MNTEQVKAMTDDELRIKIAKFFGYKIKKSMMLAEDVASYGSGLADLISMSLKGKTIDPPNYTTDLNAINDAVSKMVKTHGIQWRISFNSNLYSILGHHDHVEDEAIHATARQRAEAFVLTMEK